MDDALVDNTGVMTFCVLASMYVLEGKMLDFTNVLTRVEITEGERYKKGGGRVHAPRSCYANRQQATQRSP